MTESALQIPHLTQTVDEWLAMTPVACEGNSLVRAPCITRAGRMVGGRWGSGAAHPAVAGRGWRGRLGRCRRSTSWCAVGAEMI